MERSHQDLVVGQFGGQAQAYVESAVHAQGADLDWIEAAVREAAPARVLDMGCGGGHVSYRAAPHAGVVVAYDLSAEMLAAVDRTARQRGLDNIEPRQGPAEVLPFEDGAFDMVLCRFSAHHWTDFNAGLSEAARVLKPGGRALFVDGVAAPRPQWDTHLQAIEQLRDPSHVRDYSLAEWAGALDRAGLITREVRTSRIRLDFSSWIERMRTPPVAALAIRYLQDTAPKEARNFFGIESNGSFNLDTAWFATVR